jgi:hypothetical protein
MSASPSPPALWHGTRILDLPVSAAREVGGRSREASWRYKWKVRHWISATGAFVDADRMIRSLMEKIRRWLRRGKAARKLA